MSELLPTYLRVKCPNCGKVTDIRTKEEDVDILCRGMQGKGYCQVTFHVHLGRGKNNLRVTVNNMTIKPLTVAQ